MKIIVFGPPCSGKTTVAAALAERLGIAHLSFQGLCVAQFKANSEIGLRWNYYMSNGKPFDESLANCIASESLRTHKAFVIEGYPKRRYEVSFFCACVGSPDLALVLSASRESLYMRAQRRRVCIACNLTFSLDYFDLCPQCGNLGAVRKEDSPDRLAVRLDEYQMQENDILPELGRISLQCFSLSTDNESPVDVLESIVSMMCY